MKNSLMTLAISLLVAGCTQSTLSYSEVPHKVKDHLKSVGAISNRENVIYYSSISGFDIDAAYIISDSRILYYNVEPKSKQISIKDVHFNEIKSIEVQYGDGFELLNYFVVTDKKGSHEFYFFDSSAAQMKSMKRYIELRIDQTD